MAFHLHASQLRTIRKAVLSIGAMAILAVLVPFGPIQPAHAATITSYSVTMSNVTASTPSNTTILFTTPTGVTAGQTIKINWTSFNIASVVFGDVTFKDGASTLTVAGTCSGTTWGFAVSGQDMVLTSCTGTIAAGHVITVQTANNHITNPAAGSYKVAVTGGTFADTGTSQVVVLSSANSPVSIDAAVDPSVTFAWTGGNALHFGTLTTANTFWATTGAGATTETASGMTFTLGTNATGGAIVSVLGTSLAGPQTITAISGGPTAMAAAGTAEQFGLRFTRSGSGATAIASPFNGASNNYGFNSGVVSTVVNTGGGVSVSDTVTMYVAANILPTTKPGSYSTTLTFVATGTF